MLDSHRPKHPSELGELFSRGTGDHKVQSWLESQAIVLTDTSFQIVVAITFAVTELSYEALAVVVGLVVAFGAYDVFVQRKVTEIIQHSARSNAIVSSLFPANFHDRLPFPESKNKVAVKQRSSLIILGGRKTSARKFFKDFYGDEERNDEEDRSSMSDSKPIADLYPDTTIMLLDLVGFTAWSSAREPSAVFMLLESIFSAL